MKEFKLKLYTSPSCTVMEMKNEGVLCASDWSGGIDHDGIVGDDNDIFNN